MKKRKRTWFELETSRWMRYLSFRKTGDQGKEAKLRAVVWGDSCKNITVSLRPGLRLHSEAFPKEPVSDAKWIYKWTVKQVVYLPLTVNTRPSVNVTRPLSRCIPECWASVGLMLAGWRRQTLTDWYLNKWGQSDNGGQTMDQHLCQILTPN